MNINAFLRTWRAFFTLNFCNNDPNNGHVWKWNIFNCIFLFHYPRRKRLWSETDLIRVKCSGEPFFVCTCLAILMRAKFKIILKDTVKQIKAGHLKLSPPIWNAHKSAKSCFALNPIMSQGLFEGYVWE